MSRRDQIQTAYHSLGKDATFYDGLFYLQEVR